MMRYKSMPTDKEMLINDLKGGSWQKRRGHPCLLGLKKS
jgi:hypothetical protein